jgi:DNA (cytosine-5)-methyltransferase 1
MWCWSGLKFSSGNHVNYVEKGEGKLKFLDLFAGIGGFRLGMEQAGHECVGFCEIDKFARASYKAIHNTEGETEFHDITSVTDGEWRKFRGTVDIICGGFPCQPFSLAGKGKAENDDRYLWHEFARLVKEIRPRWVVGENVPGILNRGLETTVSDLEKEGYEVWVFSVAASDIGAIHKRQRFFIVACNTHSQSIIQEDSPTCTFRSERQAWQSSSWKYWREFRELHRKVPEPGICRVDDGVSRELDKNRLIALGNAVQPQQVYPIFKAIMEIENGS